MKSSNFKIDFEVYGWLLNSLNNLALKDCKKGQLSDLSFIKEDFWLPNTAVIENVNKRAGTWRIGLLFADYQHPTKFIKRNIRSETSHQKALLIASILRRQAAKDQRGTLTVSLESFHLNKN